MLLFLRKAFHIPGEVKLHRAMLGMLALVIIPLSLGGAGLLAQQWRYAKEDQETSLKFAAESLAHGLDMHLRYREAQLEAIAALPAFSRGDLSEVEQHARAVLGEHKDSSIALIDGQGQMRFSTAVRSGMVLPNVNSWRAEGGPVIWNGHPIPQGTVLSPRVFQAGRVTYSDLFFSFSLRQPALVIAVPVRVQGRVAYGLGLAFPATELAQVLKGLGVPYKAEVVVVDRKGLVVASSAGPNVATGEKLPHYLALMKRDGGFEVQPEQDGSRIASAWHVSDSGLGVFVRLPESALLREARNVTLGWGLLLLVMLLLSGAAAARLSRRIAMPLRALAARAPQVDFSTVEPSGIQEIDSLALALKRGADIERLRREETVRRVAAEEKQAGLLERQAEMRNVFDNLQVYVAVLDATGTVEDVNKELMRTRKAAREDLIGLSFWDCPWWAANPATREQIRKATERACKGKRVRFDVLGRSFAGTERTVDLQLSPMRDDEGRVVRVIACAVDVDERVKAEAGLRAADRQKDNFLATLGHELRNPLAPIRSAAAILRLRRIPDPAVKRASEVIERQAAHMTRLVDDLLDVSRITRDVIRIRQDLVDLSQVLAVAVESCQPSLRAAGVALRMDEPSESLWVMGDPTRLSQALLNLLVNAAKFTPHGGCVHLSLRKMGAEAVIEVSDNGIGLAPESLEQIFELFAQVRPSGVEGHAGLGIGLALARRLVRMHGGDLVAASRGLGQGSTFTIRLPLLQARSSEPDAARAEGIEG